MIDVHMHFGRSICQTRLEPPVDEAEILGRMDELGIARAALLPLVSPEAFCFPSTSEEAIAISRRHPDRLFPFCNVDPRSGRNSPDTDFRWLLRHYRDQGCRGLGEFTPNLWFDDPLCLNLYCQCGEVGFPVLFDMVAKLGYGHYGVVDEPGQPRLERALAGCPQTVFIGHGPGFWSHIAADVPEQTRGGYPQGPVGAPGRVPELMAKYPNLWADLSAFSGFNAISRDSEFGYRFLEQFQHQLLFGTDICQVNQPVPQAAYLRQARAAGKVSQACFDKIVRENAVRLLGL